MASNDPAHPPAASGALPYPPADQTQGALPYPPVSQPGVLPYPSTDNAGALPYPTSGNSAGPGALPYPTPQMDNNTPGANAMPYPSMPAAGAAAESKGAESKMYTDAPPPYSPPVGGAPYPTPVGAPGQMPPPQPGYAAYPGQQMAYAAPGVVTVTRTVQSTGAPTVVVRAGNCPQCGVGVLSENFTLMGICCAFWFFPIGLICCLSMRERRCTSCGAAFA